MSSPEFIDRSLPRQLQGKVETPFQIGDIVKMVAHNQPGVLAIRTLAGASRCVATEGVIVKVWMNGTRGDAACKGCSWTMTVTLDYDGHS